MAVYSDNFTRANGSLGSNWTDWSWSGTGGTAVGAVISSNTAAGGSAGSSGDYWNAGAFANDQYSEAVIAAVPGTSWAGVTVRQSGNGGNGYLGLWDSNDNFYLFRETGADSPPQLGSAVSGTVSPGDTIRIQAVGSTISLLHNGTPVITVSDTAYTSGAAGIAFFGTSGSFSSWTGGDATGILVADTSSLPDGVQNVAYKRWLAASGGTTPYTWSESGSLPPGISLSPDGVLSGTPTTAGSWTFTLTVTDSASAAYPVTVSISVVSAPLSPSSPSTDANGVITWSVTSAANLNDAETIRVLRPANPSPRYSHSFTIALPVEAGTDATTYGNGLDTIRTLGLHDTCNTTVIEPSTGGYWLADNPANPALLQETYLRQVTAWARSQYGTGSENVYLIGLSRTGLTLLSLVLRNPDIYQGGASWDFPGAMTTYDGTDALHGTVGGAPADSYGTQDNYAANYELTGANISRWAAGHDFTTVQRLWIGGYNAFQADVNQADTVLTAAGIAHAYSSVAEDTHNWSPNPGWIATAMQSMLTLSGKSPGPSYTVATAYRDDDVRKIHEKNRKFTREAFLGIPMPAWRRPPLA